MFEAMDMFDEIEGVAMDKYLASDASNEIHLFNPT